MTQCVQPQQYSGIETVREASEPNGWTDSAIDDTLHH